MVLIAVAALGLGASFVGSSSSPSSTPDPATLAAVASQVSAPRALPIELRGVHVTMGLASLPGKLEEYVDLESEGLTALELDVKDENGEIGFVSNALPLARSIGAARDYYDARETARMVHDRGLYLVGRLVTFEDPVLSAARPELAVRRSDGSVWRDGAGLGWTNPYDRRVWDYNVDVAIAAARAGFDEIMFDYVRFPSDGDVDSAVFRNQRGMKKNDAIPAFLRYAARRLSGYDVRISAAVFGLSGTRDLGIGQLPRRMAPYLDTLYAMTYPSLFAGGRARLAGSQRCARGHRREGATEVRGQAPWTERAHRSVGPGLQLHDAVRVRRGPRADLLGASLGREGLHALECRGPLHRRRAHTALGRLRHGASRSFCQPSLVSE